MILPSLASKHILGRRVAKMVEQEDLELTSFHQHTKIATIYRTIIDENDRQATNKQRIIRMVEAPLHDKMVSVPCQAS